MKTETKDKNVSEAQTAFEVMVYNITYQYWSHSAVLRHCASHVDPAMASAHFPGPAARLYRQMVEADQKMELNTVTFQAMKDNETSEWMDAMNATVDSYDTVNDTVSYAGRLKQRFESIRTLGILADGQKAIMGGESPDEVMKGVIARAMENQMGNSTYLHRSDTLAASMLDEVSKIRTGEAITGYRVRTRLLRDVFPVWNAQELTTIGASPKNGKSIFAQSVAYDVLMQMAEREDSGCVLYFSPDMSARQVLSRMAFQEAGLDSRMVASFSHDAYQKAGKEKRQEWDEIWNAYSSALMLMGSIPLIIDDYPGVDPDYLRYRVAGIHSQLPVKMTIVDFIQNVVVKEARTEHEGVSESYRAVKDVMRITGAPAVVTSQMTKSSATNPSEMPALKDLLSDRGMDPDNVVLLRYPISYLGERDWQLHELYRNASDSTECPHVVYGNAAKVRNGTGGVHRARYVPPGMSVAPYQMSEDEQVEALSLPF